MSVASAIMVTAMGVHAPSVEAKSLRLTSKKVTLTVGKSKTIKVRGAKKVTWKVTSGGKCIRLASKTRTSVKITAKKAGSAKVQAKAGNKKLSCKVTVKPSKQSRKAVVLNVTKVDDATVKKVHETLSKGNTLRLRINGGTESQRTKTMDNLKTAVSKYNEYGVRPQLSRHTTKSYTEWEADSELAGQYKWGLLLVKDFISSHKNDYLETKQTAAKNLATEESFLKDKYKYEGDEWKKTFEEVTGITYTKRGDYSNPNNEMLVECFYTDGQTAKSKQVKTNTDFNWSADKDYYYTTIKYNGTEYKVTEPIQLETTATGFEDDDDWNRIINDKSKYVCKTEIGGTKVEIPASDITFHYEPLTVDLTAVDTAINTKYETDLNAYKAENNYEGSSGGRIDKLLYENKFCDLSSAVQQYWVQKIFHGVGDYTAYEFEYAYKLTKDSSIKYLKNPKGRIHGDDGAEGLRLLYQCKWMGVCSNYARAEMTVYKLFGVQGKIISCHKCNHAWTVVKLTNSNGEVFYAKNNYGLNGISYTTMPNGCIGHNKSQNANIKHNDFTFNSLI